MLMTLFWIYTACWVGIGLLWLLLGACKLLSWTGENSETMRGVFK